ncbi:MAG: hypothetical protein JSS82_13335 [Bacteroidetes bacterium]|nr:hypothetical protein [Bacteroidota bacterium]
MEARKQRTIKSGTEYDHLFPAANVDTHTVMKNAGVGDTVAFIPKVVHKTLDHTKKIAGILKGNSDYETCRNIWHFVYGHIAYRKDREGYEQIRSPARSWHDRKAGVDCDCYTTFISSILTNLGIRHKLRITKYHRDYFQHIYPVAEVQGKQVVIDCVTDKFDYEVPFSEKKDYKMDLQYLNGLDGYSDGYMDGTGGMEELGKLFKKKAKSGGSSGGGGKKKKGGIFKKIGGAVKKAGQGIKKAAKKVNLKKVLNVVNKFNPATIALRNGVLASMKLNIGNVGKRLRWSYITPEQAKAKKMDMAKWNKLVEARKKLEKIFYGAGGKPENMKKAILNGKGNKNHEVHGLDGFGALYDHRSGRFHRPMMANHVRHISPMHPHHPVNRLHKRMPVRNVIGNEMFESENPVGELGELGEPITAATIAAASGVIAAIASTLKKIGDIFGGKGKGSEDFDEEANKEAEKEIPESKNDEDAKAAASIESGGSSDEGGSSSGGSSKGSASSSGGGGGSSDEGSSSGGSSGGGGGSSTEVATTESSGGGDDVNGGAEAPTKAVAKSSPGAEADDGGGKDSGGGSFMEKNKKWIMPVGIGLGVITVGALIAKAMKPPTPAPSASRKPMHGVPHRRASHKRKPKAAAKPKPKPKAKHHHKAKPKGRKRGKLSAMTV